jgi:all-trans-retinol 13,14-reductase
MTLKLGRRHRGLIPVKADPPQSRQTAAKPRGPDPMSPGFDAIVVGSGLGGLTAGALCAQAGLRVLVLERNETFGGAATVYRHNGLAIEASLHELDGFDEDDPKLPLIRTLGLNHALQFIDVGDLFEVRGAAIGAPFVLPHGPREALAAATARFPHHKAGLEEYFRRLAALRGAVSMAAQHMDDRSWWLTHAPEALHRLWPLLRDGRATLGEVLNELFGADEAVKLALAANLAYYHDDPDSMRFLRYAVPQASYLAGGGRYIRGGSQALADWLGVLIVQAGGALQAGRQVVQLLTDKNGIAGVRHHARHGNDESFDMAPLVFGNAAPQVLAGMLPEDRRATFLAPYAARRQSISLWTISLGLNRPARDFGVRRYSTIVLPNWLQSLWQMREAAAVIGGPPGEQVPPYVFVDFGQIDSGLNRAGANLVTFCGIDRLENWSDHGSEAKQARKDQWIDCLIADIDREFPGLAGAVVHREMATAETIQRYLNTPGGAAYGFAPEGTLGQIISQGPRTSIDGLWLASAYTVGGGFTGAMVGGAQAARQAMRSHKARRG